MVNTYKHIGTPYFDKKVVNHIVIIINMEMMTNSLNDK